MKKTLLSVVMALALPGYVSGETSSLDQLKALQGDGPEAVAIPKASALGGETTRLQVKRRVDGIGLSHSGDPLDIPDFTQDEVANMLKEAGGTHYRPHLPLKEALPLVSAAQVAQLRQAKDDPALMDAMIEDISVNGRWERMDNMVNAFTSRGIKLVLVVGCGYSAEMPMVEMSNGSKRIAYPLGIGRDLYITLNRWLVGGAVRRYASQVEFWQVENEITNAWLISLPIHRWRVPDPAWLDNAYLIRLLAALSETVHSEGERQGRNLKTTHNFLTSTPNFANDVKTFGSKANLDIIGIDLYGNYVMGSTGWPLLHDLMVADVAKTVRLANGKPVWVLEAGYPRGPWVRGFTETGQAEYFRKLFKGSYEAGAGLVLAFGWFWNPAGWYTSGGPPPPWFHPIMAAEPYWSPLQVRPNPDGSKEIHFGPAWDEFKKAAGEWVGAQ